MRCFPILNDAIFCSMFFNFSRRLKKLQNIVQTMHINDVFAKNSKTRKKPILKKYFFLQIGYTEEIRAVNYHFFVQKSAQYRHKILNVCVKVCIKTRPESHKESPWFVALNRRKKWLIHYSCPLLFTCPEQCVSRYE